MSLLFNDLDFLKKITEYFYKNRFFSLEVFFKEIFENDGKIEFFLYDPISDKEFSYDFRNNLSIANLKITNRMISSIFKANLKTGKSVEMKLDSLRNNMKDDNSFEYLNMMKYNYLISYPIYALPFNYVIFIVIYLKEEPQGTFYKRIFNLLHDYLLLIYDITLGMIEEFMKNEVHYVMQHEIPLELDINLISKRIQFFLNLDNIKTRLVSRDKKENHHSNYLYEFLIEHSCFLFQISLNHIYCLVLEMRYPAKLLPLFINSFSSFKESSKKFRKKFEFLIEILRIHTKYLNVKSELVKQAFMDSLTGVYNRKALDLIKKEWNRLKNVLLIYFDLDNFKEINDRYGHDVGDFVLIQFVNAIRSVIRVQDLIFRMGGDEFLLIVLDTSKDNYGDVIERIKSLFPLKLNHKKVNLSLNTSMGCVFVENCQEMPFEDAIKISDKEMYNDKKSKKGLRRNKSLTNLPS